MKNLMQSALGDDWQKLPPALQAHYRPTCTDAGSMTIEYPRIMQPYLMLLRRLGALIDRTGENITTVVNKHMANERQIWHRTMTWPDQKTLPFNSTWIHAGGNELIEFVNPLLGLQMAAHVEEGRLHYSGIRFIAQLGRLRLPLPEWLLGHTTIVEEALSDTRFAMDFRLTHPIFGQVFRYWGEFETSGEDERQRFL